MCAARPGTPIVMSVGAGLIGALFSGPTAATPSAGPDRGAVDYVRTQSHERTTGVRAGAGDASRAEGNWQGQALRDGKDAAKRRDLRTADFYFSRKRGRLIGIAGFQAVPTAKKTSVALVFGRLSGNTCKARALIGAQTRSGVGVWARYNDQGDLAQRGKAHVKRIGKRVMLSARARALKKVGANCAYATVGHDRTVYDDTGYIGFQETGPYLEYYLGSAFLNKTSTPPHTGAVVGQQKKIRIGIKNGGYGIDSSPVRKVVVGARGKNLSVKPKNDPLGAIDFPDEKWANFRAKLTKHKARTLSWTALGDFGWAEGNIVVHPLRKPLKTGKTLVGKRFWAKGSLSWRPHGLWFVNKRFVYVGFPKKGKPRCVKATKKCARYTFKSRKGTVTIRGRKGKVRKHTVAWQGRTYRPMATPKRGATWKTSLMHTNATTSGTLENLFIWTNPNGTFTTRRSTYARSTERTAARDLPEGSGTYKVKRNGHVVFRFRNGKKAHASIGILTTGSSRPNPWDSGLMIGNTYYTLSG